MGSTVGFNTAKASRAIEEALTCGGRGKISFGVLVHVNGCRLWFQPLLKGAMPAMRTLTWVAVPPRLAGR